MMMKTPILAADTGWQFEQESDVQPWKSLFDVY